MKELFFFEKKNSMSNFYDNNYAVKLDKNTLEITGKNAQIYIVIEKEKFTKKQYKLIKEPFTSSIRIAGLYSRQDEKKPRAPKNYTRRMLCYGLYLLLQHNIIYKSDIISLEADPSDNNNLVNKVYIPMGFQLVAKTENNISGGLMKSNVKTILSWCKNIN
jgi:hypothetical protein